MVPFKSVGKKDREIHLNVLSECFGRNLEICDEKLTKTVKNKVFNENPDLICLRYLERSQKIIFNKEFDKWMCYGGESPEIATCPIWYNFSLFKPIDGEILYKKFGQETVQALTWLVLKVKDTGSSILIINSQHMCFGMLSYSYVSAKIKYLLEKFTNLCNLKNIVLAGDFPQFSSELEYTFNSTSLRTSYNPDIYTCNQVYSSERVRVCEMDSSNGKSFPPGGKKILKSKRKRRKGKDTKLGIIEELITEELYE